MRTMRTLRLTNKDMIRYTKRSLENIATPEQCYEFLEYLEQLWKPSFTHIADWVRFFDQIEELCWDRAEKLKWLAEKKKGVEV